ncbi:hypothetical protein [Micromonospora sp. NPDC049679]|uniref:hypothetical protein n=1 Tax=Micromonospora sp. NPDC049679 TaxID=3155920 RepID=UPI00340F5EA1
MSRRASICRPVVGAFAVAASTRPRRVPSTMRCAAGPRAGSSTAAEQPGNALAS